MRQYKWRGRPAGQARPGPARARARPVMPVPGDAGRKAGGPARPGQVAKPVAVACPAANAGGRPNGGQRLPIYGGHHKWQSQIYTNSQINNGLPN